MHTHTGSTFTRQTQFDAKQVVSAVVGAIAVVGLVFLVALHLGKEAVSETETPPGREAPTVSKELALSAAADPKGAEEYEFFELLEAPAPARDLPPVEMALNPALDPELKQQKKKEEAAKKKSERKVATETKAAPTKKGAGTDTVPTGVASAESATQDRAKKAGAKKEANKKTAKNDQTEKEGAKRAATTNQGKSEKDVSSSTAVAKKASTPSVEGIDGAESGTPTKNVGGIATSSKQGGAAKPAESHVAKKAERQPEARKTSAARAQGVDADESVNSKANKEAGSVAKSKGKSSATHAEPKKKSEPKSEKQPETKTAAAQSKSAKYGVQVSSFQDKGAADSLASDLKSKGLRARVTSETIPGRGVWYRVQVGKVSDKAEAEKIRARVKRSAGLDGFVTTLK